MPRIKLNKSTVGALPIPTSGQVEYRDTELVGFGVRVGTNTKSYFVEKRIGRRSRRVKIGEHPLMSCEETRKRAERARGDGTGQGTPSPREGPAGGVL